MARDDTRLHRLEAMVAGLLAWQNAAEKRLKDLEKRQLGIENTMLCWSDAVGWLADEGAGGPEPAGAKLGDAPDGPCDGGITDHDRKHQQRDSRPAPAQAAYTGDYFDLSPDAYKKRTNERVPLGTVPASPKQAAYRDWACDECVKGIQEPDGEWSRCKDGRCNIELGGIDFCPKQAAQPAPRQPQDCTTCRWDYTQWLPDVMARPLGHCGPCDHKFSHWQPRSGGG